MKENSRVSEFQKFDEQRAMVEPFLGKRND